MQHQPLLRVPRVWQQKKLMLLGRRALLARRFCSLLNPAAAGCPKRCSGGRLQPHYCNKGSHGVLPSAVRVRSQSTQTSPPTATSTTTPVSDLRKLVKPFLLQCHPDVHNTESAKKINLEAIQNLNGFLDTLQSVASGKLLAQRDYKEIVQIDFVLNMKETKNLGKKKRQGDNVSRRAVQLQFPPLHLCQSVSRQHPNSNSLLLVRELYEHARYELSKLMQMAGLKIPPPTWKPYNDAVGGVYSQGFDSAAGATPVPPPSYSRTASGTYEASSSDGFRRAHSFRATRPKTAFEQSRDRFTSNIDWERFDKVYQASVQDMEADLATEGMIKKDTGRRHQMISTVLANARIQKDEATGQGIGFLDQLVAFRRLAILLEQHFEKLQMEDFGSMWENCQFLLTPARPYNTSRSALNKRRKSNSATGFSFTLHPDMSVTIQIPVDFRDDELIDELDRNVWDFYDLTTEGLDDYFPNLHALGL
jgi:hypothetical protein